MKLMKLLLAAVLVLVGSLGVALSVVAISQTRATAARLERDLPLAIGRVESVVAGSHQRAESAVDFLQTTRNRLTEVQTTVEDFSYQGRGRLSALFDSLDVDVVKRLERAEEFVRSLQTGLQSASSMMLLFESLPFVAPRVSPAGREADGELKLLASDLTAFNETLELIADALSTIRTDGAAGPEEIALLQNALRRADEEIQSVQLGLDDVSSELESMAGWLSAVKAASGGRIRRLAGFVQVFFVCFAASQISLAARGMRSLLLLWVSADSECGASRW